MNCFVSYEKFAKEFSNEELMLQYKILFRRWDLLVEVDEKFFQKKVQRPIKNIEGITWGETDFILRDLIEWNFDYLEEYAKFCANDNLIAIVEKIKKDSSDIHTLFTYDEYINTNRDESVFDMFFMGAAPLLNVSEIIGQELPSEQVEKNKISLVLDEVGSGKSVSAIIEISKVINNKVFENKESNILIICPSMLREKWQNDIRRQLGRYSYVVKSGDQNDECFKENLKSVFFKRNEKCIFIIDNISIKRSISEYKNNIEQNDINYFTMWSKNFPWDFVVIDECHLCNNNYNKVRAEKAMFLTATPIVKFSKTQYSKDVNNLRDYANIMKEITNLQYYNKEIDPIEERNTTIDSIFVNRFREDFKIVPTKRIIRFEECGRIEEFLSYSEKIAAKKNSLTADHYAQDDEYLVKKYNEIFNENVNINMNSKCDKLKEIIRNENKSFIVFCEHKEVVDSIYAALK